MVRALRNVDCGGQEIGARGAAPTIAWKTGRGEVATNRQIAGEATARAESLAREIQLFEDRCRRVGQRIEDGILHFVGGVDMAYDAAISLGLSEGAGDDAVQAMLARASIRPDIPQMTTRSDAPSRGAGPPLLSIDESRAEKRCTEQDRRWRRIDEELDRQRKQKRQEGRQLATLRVSELNRLYNVRYRGGSLPDDDDGRDNVEIMVNHLALLAAPHWRIKDWIRRMAPWWEESKLEKLIDKVIAQPRRWTADTLGRRLNLTSDERDPLKIRTIGAVDLDKAGRERWRRERDRQAKEANRRAAGAKPQVQSAARTKPWIAAGVSRAKWYADRRAARQGQTMSNSGQFGPQYKSVVLSKTKYARFEITDVETFSPGAEKNLARLRQASNTRPSRAAAMLDCRRTARVAEYLDYLSIFTCES